MRVPRLAVYATALALVAGGGTAYVVTHTSTSSPHGPSAAPTPAVSRPVALAPVSATGSAAVPSPAGVAAAVRTLQRDPALGGGLVADVVDAASGAALLGREVARPVPPASTAKLLTATAALEALGPAARLTTRVVRSGSTLYLVGGGDVTLSGRRPDGYPQPARLAQLAAATARRIGAGHRVTIRVDTSAWSGPTLAAGWTPVYLTEGDVARPSPLEVDEARVAAGQPSRYPDPAVAAGQRFAEALRAAGVEPIGDVSAAIAPAGATPVATVDSPPVSALVHRLLTVSDNDLAESLARAVAIDAGAAPTFSGAGAAVVDRIRALGVPTAGVRLYDGSGLSRLDRVTAQCLVAVVRLAGSAAHPELRPVLAGLPVAGLTGTLADRYRDRPARAGAGDVRAKTGNLVGVDTLAGEVVDADGRLLVFAFLTDRATGPAAAEAALDRLAARLARCGCR